MCLDIANQASLTTYAEGLPFSEYMRDAAEDNARLLELLQLAGEWLDAYHRTKVSETRIFQPKHAVNYYHDLVEKIQSGDLKIAAKPLFCKGLNGWLNSQTNIPINKLYLRFNMAIFICAI